MRHCQIVLLCKPKLYLNSCGAKTEPAKSLKMFCKFLYIFKKKEKKKKSFYIHFCFYIDQLSIHKLTLLYKHEVFLTCHMLIHGISFFLCRKKEMFEVRCVFFSKVFCSVSFFTDQIDTN